MFHACRQLGWGRAGARGEGYGASSGPFGLQRQVRQREPSVPCSKQSLQHGRDKGLLGSSYALHKDLTSMLAIQKGSMPMLMPPCVCSQIFLAGSGGNVFA